MKIRNVLRSLLWLVMQTHAGRVQLGGQTDRVVVVDETFFTKKKKNTGGFVGRTTLGHKTIVMGFLELQLSTRKATGACVLIEIPNRNLKARDPKACGSWIAHFHRPSQVVQLSVSSEQWLCTSGCEPQPGRVLSHGVHLWRRRRCDHQLRGRLVWPASSNICDNANMARSGSQLTADCWQSSCGAKGVQLSGQSLYGIFSGRSRLGRTSIHDVLRHPGIG